MKIGRGELEKIYNPALNDSGNTADKKQKNDTTVATDKIVLSDKAKEYSPVKNFVDSVVKEVTRQTPSEKLLKLKNEVSSGKYHVSSEDIAESIIGNAKKIQ
ncbi:MAG: hypothetical protein A2Y15_04835 [Clostridiales bacterium GWF2_36_10]|nr:MAG: hypothetical protein A2Y15_04835 [Clostridiales bacterium GWF2_36_10]